MKVFINGVDTASFDFELVDMYIPPLPTVEDYTTKIADRDGELDMGMSYGPRTIQLTFFITNHTALSYHEKIAAASVVFNPKLGDRELTFDGDLAGKRYMARAAGTIPFTKGVELRTFTVPMKMHQPYPESLNESIYEGTITEAPQTVQVESHGTVDTPPLITITNTGSNTIHGFTLRNEYEVD